MPGKNSADALVKFGDWTVEIVKRSDHAAGFEVLPRRWVVERTLAWLNRNRRLAKDFEASIASAKAWLIIASVQLLTRRVACSGSSPSDSSSDTNRRRCRARLTIGTKMINPACNGSAA